MEAAALPVDKSPGMTPFEQREHLMLAEPRSCRQGAVAVLVATDRRFDDASRTDQRA
jgi:hypothetical protein